MKKAILFFIIASISGFVIAQTTNYEMKFRYQNKDTLLNRDQIRIWNNAGSFPDYLDWKNSPFSLGPSGNDRIGLYTDSTQSFTTGQDVGWAFIKVASTGFFMNDYYESNIGMMVNDTETPNVEIISSAQGLMMRALTNIAPNTEIKSRYRDIINIYPNDLTLKLLIHK